MFQARFGHLPYPETGSDTDAASGAYKILYSTFKKVLLVMAKMAHVLGVRIRNQYHRMDFANSDGSIDPEEEPVWTLPAFLAAQKSGNQGSETVTIAVTDDVESPTDRASVWVKLPLTADSSHSHSITLDYAIGGNRLGRDALMADGSGSLQSSRLSNGKAFLTSGEVP